MDRSPGYSELTNPRAVMTTQSSELPAQPASTATAPALMDHLAVGLVGSQTPVSLTSFAPGGVIGPPAPPTPHRLMRRGHSQLKTAKVTQVTNNHINIGYDERHRAAPTVELHSSLAHDIGHVVRTHCLMQ
ncbi:unnamed protein product [Prunus armeniaca]